MLTLAEEIATLRKERNAVILAHNYVTSDIQDIADFTGDSLELSIKAKELKAGVIVFCGVRFMAETAKLLSPHSTVLLPNLYSGCPMADMADPSEVAAYKKANPDTVLVAYVNSTAEVKAQVDICCTSGNAEKIIRSIPADKKIMFLPDRNLGANMMNKLNCPPHNKLPEEMIREARRMHPEAKVLVHPECRPEIVAEADEALSTGGILRFVRESADRQFIIGTETGILHRLAKENPEKEFFPLKPEMLCPNMKKITLQEVADALAEMRNVIELPPELMARAVLPIERMLAVK